MNKKWQITPVNTEKMGNGYEVELAHDQDKKNWYVTIKGNLYIEFTFDLEKDALGMYDLVKKPSNLFMDSILIGTDNYKIAEGGK